MTEAELQLTKRYYALRPLAWFCCVYTPSGTVLLVLGPNEFWYRWFFFSLTLLPLLLLVAAYCYWRVRDPRRAHIW